MPALPRMRGLVADAIVAAILLLACSGSNPETEPPPPPKLEVLFTPSGGTFRGSETVQLSSDPAAEIHYTTDGSLPTVASPIYTQPVVMVESTRLRAVAAAPQNNGSSVNIAGTSGMAGQGPAVTLRLGPVKTSSYLRVADESAEFSSHLPLVLIQSFESGAIDPNSDEFVPATLQVIEPSAGAANILGRAALDTRIGIHVRGSTSRKFPKKQYALEFWGELTNDDMDHGFLGMPAESDWVLSDAPTFDRTLIRNALAYQLSNLIGRYAPRTQFAEVYLVLGKSAIDAGSYLGFYTAIEKIKRGAQRVNVQKLSAGTSEAALSGGYLLRIDKGTNDFSAASSDWQFVYPDSLEMKEPNYQPHLDFIRDYIAGFGRATAASDFIDPTTGKHYSAFIDVDAFIDHNILNALLKNVDGLRISAYFSKDRDGLLAAGPIWDFDRSSGTPYDERAVEPEEWKRAGSDGTDYLTFRWYGQLLRDPSFKSRYITRFQALLANEFSPDRLDGVIDGLVQRVGPAAERNFARWTDSPPKDGSYAAEVAILKEFLRRRVGFVQGELDAGL
jgi:hypothetical protein